MISYDLDSTLGVHREPEEWSVSPRLIKTYGTSFGVCTAGLGYPVFDKNGCEVKW